jgi:hypothetical protein
MNVHENDDGNNYNFYTAEPNSHIAKARHECNGRVMVPGTYKVNLDPDEKNLEPRSVFRLSFDQPVTRPHVAAAFSGTTRFQLSPT